ncbi:MAG: FkbM family methyltransferase [Verrucomicrobiales bacterium]|jgi:FkbM family methyltransferase
MKLPATLDTPLRAIKYWIDGTPEIRLTKLLSDPERMSIDVGANIGQFTWWMRRYAKGVVAFEPNAALASRLNRAFPGGDVVVKAAAASDAVGQAELAIPIGPDGERAAAASLSNNFDNQRTVLVDLERIDDLDVGPIGYIKIDVEGHELDVLRGARATLERDRPALLVEIELRHHDGEIDGKIREICDIGYSAYFMLDGRLHPLSEFRSEMQDPSKLTSPAKYVNNFIFLASR